MNTITLNPTECRVATVVGTARAENARIHGFRDRSHLADDERLNADVDAAGAEIATSRFTGLRWTMSTGEDLSEPDLAPNIEVRHTRYPAGGLIVRTKDRPDRVFILVVGSLPTYRLVGWMRGTEAQQPRYRWTDAWKVPQSGLRGFRKAAA